MAPTQWIRTRTRTRTRPTPWTRTRTQDQADPMDQDQDQDQDPGRWNRTRTRTQDEADPMDQDEDQDGADVMDQDRDRDGARRIEPGGRVWARARLEEWLGCRLQRIGVGIGNGGRHREGGDGCWVRTCQSVAAPCCAVPYSPWNVHLGVWSLTRGGGGRLCASEPSSAVTLALRSTGIASIEQGEHKRLHHDITRYREIEV